MKKIEKACKTLNNNMLDGERTGWPPVCYGVFHQPERPVEELKVEKKEKN